ncbi:hypothetical protein HUJ05_000171 [Dendroctonus ponderosae]|nr:hypothetical protein HUJ05_000171 [Dendroctonus ponderosae]
MSLEKVQGEVEVFRLPADAEEFEWNNWKFKYTKSHILHSLCTSPEKCKNQPVDQCLLCLPAEHLGEKLKPFDWTFSTDYCGTLSANAHIEPTEEIIDMEMLKQKEKILFYHEMMLYEDELHDNGISSCTIKIRVMPSSFFILLRFFLRVDGVMVRVNDTRVFHDFTKNFIIREYTNKECGVKELKLPLTLFGDPNSLSPHMPLRTSIVEKITFPGET